MPRTEETPTLGMTTRRRLPSRAYEVALTVRIPRALRVAARLAAIQAGLTMQDYVSDAVREALARCAPPTVPPPADATKESP